MKKQGLFLAAGLAVISAGAFASGQAFAVDSMISLESEDDEKLARALIYNAQVDGLSYGESLTSDAKYLFISEDASKPGEIYLNCANGDPLEGVKDYSLLSRSDMSDFLSEVEAIDLCSADNVDWDELAKLPRLYNLGISPVAHYWELSTQELLDLRDEVATKPIVDISGISKLAHLNLLWIVGVPLGSLQTIPQLEQIDTSFLLADGIRNIDGLFDMPNLNAWHVNNYTGFNNIEDFQPFMDYCVERSACEEGDWDSVNDYFALETRVRGNRTIIETSSENPEIPAYFRGLIEMYEEEGYDNGVWTDGLSYAIGGSTVKLDLGVSKHVLTIADPEGEEGFSVEFVYKEKQEENDNPETLDHSILGWAIGAAVAIMASASLMIRSRR